MEQPILLDTCAMLFLGAGGIKPAARALLSQAELAKVTIFVSPISAWELGILVTRGRLILPMTVEAWFQAAIKSGARLAEMTPEILIASSFLPAAQFRDPADRILAATARALSYRLMTRDGPLLDYAAKGHLNAIPC